ncbi:hypothetical protein K469DRAFT_317044 [Zopfia rhizophila CBS 207.26]|uniref:Uncharacterized protein n=1 Tax=Zopfia rhizophila CBS 207.26 TaxID=1314779 RepID=A0A6A6ENR4_9PEZI|nr:hypothetical protein K469DRAFT_317044 [Zopfia rhizophila CBS 207.26]
MTDPLAQRNNPPQSTLRIPSIQTRAPKLKILIIHFPFLLAKCPATQHRLSRYLRNILPPLSATNITLQAKSPLPICILWDLYRIIVSEWIAVNPYLEWDLNAIEWCLERDTPNIETLNFFLEQLFIMRRRTRKCESLVADHLRLNLPSAWRSRYLPTAV